MAILFKQQRGFVSAAVFALLVSPAVFATADVGDAQLAHARAHGRMIRKRAPLLGFPPADPSSTTSSSSTEASSSAASTTSSASSTTSTNSADFWDSLTSALDPFKTQSTTSTSTTDSFVQNSTSTISSTSITNSTTSTSTSTSTTPTSTSVPAKTTATPPPQQTSTLLVGASRSTTSSQPTETPGTPQAAATAGVAVARKTIVALVAIAGSIGLAFLIWTGIRKWKFRPSRQFEDRMNDPINWQPNAVGNDYSDPASRIEAHRRNGSAGSHGSFGSSEMTHHTTAAPAQNFGYGATGGANVSRSVSGRTMQSSLNHGNSGALPPLPPHDFTAAGPSDAYDFYHNQHGGANSPPQMVENGLTRGGSLNRPVSIMSENPYDGMEDDHNASHTLPPHHGGAYAPSGPPSYQTHY